MFKLYKMWCPSCSVYAAVLKLYLSLLWPKQRFVQLRLVTRRLWKPRPDWSPASHCHAVNPHHMVQPLGLLTDELGKQVYRLLFQNCGGQISFARRETRSTCGHLLACLGTTFFSVFLWDWFVSSALWLSGLFWEVFFYVPVSEH